MEPVESAPIEGASTEDRTESELLAMAETPAYLKRARAVDEERRQVHRRCEKVRDQLLSEVRLALLEWNRFAADKPAECAAFAELVDVLQRTNDAVFSEGTRRIGRGGVGLFWSPRRSLRRIARGSVRFNHRWKAFAGGFDLKPLNQVIVAYNRNYVFEKECALRNSRLARLGFQPLPLVDVEWLLQQFPLLPELPTP